jgi:hypothetical protein
VVAQVVVGVVDQDIEQHAPEERFAIGFRIRGTLTGSTTCLATILWRSTVILTCIFDSHENT